MNATTEQIIFTESAATKVGELIAEEGNEELMLRVYVQGGGVPGSNTASPLMKPPMMTIPKWKRTE